MLLVGDGSGDSGGNSPSIQAFRAANGARIWSWSPIPSPGQPGYKTWTNNGKGGNGSTLYGGGSFWESPIVDTNHKQLIVGTGNPEPWNSRGPGANLYTDSIVALNLHTGQLKWHYQVVHHDLWDSDLPNNGVMFDGKYKIDGKMVTRPAVAYVNKVGMTFVLDRVTGKPLIPVKEVPVPQSKEANINTWPTQPVPATQNVLFNPVGKDGIPCTTPNAVTAAGVPYATATAPDGKPYKMGCAYDYYDTSAVRRRAVRDDGLARELLQPRDQVDDHVRRHRPRNGHGGHPGCLAGSERVRRPRCEPPRRLRRLHADQQLGQLHVAQPRDRQVHVPPALARDLLLRLGQHRRRYHVRRSLRHR